MTSHLPFLKKVSFFESLPDEEIRDIGSLCLEKRAKDGEIIFSEGEPGYSFYIVLDGAVKIVKNYLQKDEDKLTVCGEGQCFGELALIDDYPRSATAVATRTTELLRIRREDFQQVVRRSATISYAILCSLTTLIRDRTENFINDLKAQNRNLENAYNKLRREIDDRRRAERQLHHQAFHDSLTGLPNRALFLNRLQYVMDRSVHKKIFDYAVIYLDVDRFNSINDTFGHIMGDEILVGIAGRLKNCLRRSEVLARFSGDEFVVLAEKISTEDDAVFIANRISREFEHPFLFEGKELYITVGIGIVPGKDKYHSTVDILRDADIAMYDAKAKGLAEMQVYDESLHEKTMDLLRLETDLKGAVERREFILEYQPIVSLNECRLKGFETLVRWLHPDRGIISPEIFIPIAEKSGYILELGRWILEEACTQMRRWIDRAPEPQCRDFFVNINISGRQFMQPDFLDEFKKILSETGVPGQCLKVEMTESVLIQNVDHLVNILSELRRLGIRVALDDFGTGYSSLSYLHKFPIDVIKIDRSFVIRMSAGGEKDLVPIIISIAHNMDMEVVAEGIETVSQFQHLLFYGCEYGQGFLFSKPVRKGDAERMITMNDRDVCLWPELMGHQAIGKTL